MAQNLGERHKVVAIVFEKSSGQYVCLSKCGWILKPQIAEYLSHKARDAPVGQRPSLSDENVC